MSFISKKVFIGIDCGLKGAISIFIADDAPFVYDMPIIYTKVRRKNKMGKMVDRKKGSYDVGAIVDLLKKYSNDHVICAIEKQGTRPGEGAVSAMTIGTGYGTLIGIASALGFDVRIVTPQTWKKKYIQLSKGVIEKQIIKKMKGKSKKKGNENIKVLPIKIKAVAKTIARELAAQFYPDQADLFKLAKDDGRAESVLIGLFIKEIG